MVNQPNRNDEGTARLQWWKHQRNWFDDSARLRICCKARQIGMSTAVAAEALNTALWGETTILVSASQRQASELIRKAAMLLPIIRAGSNESMDVISCSREAIELSSGGRMLSVPAASATMQGFTGHVVVDEAAWIPDLDNVWKAIVPTISTNQSYRLSVLSTPGPQSGLFYRLWTDREDTWSRHRVTVHDAKRNGAKHDLEALRRAIVDDATWRSAYECEFVDEAHSLLPYELLAARMDPELDYHALLSELRPHEDLYAGYDVGRTRDLSVLILLSRIGDRYQWRGAIELDKTPFGDQFAMLSNVLNLRSVRRLQIDRTGLGMQLAEELVARYGDHRVEPITMTMPVKESMASLVLSIFQRGLLSIPDHRPLVDDLHSVHRTITTAGNVRYTADRASGSHADRWTALALALQAAGSAVGPMESMMDHVPDRSLQTTGAW